MNSKKQQVCTYNYIHLFRGYFVSLTVRSENEIGTIVEDVTLNEPLPRYVVLVFFVFVYI